MIEFELNRLRATVCRLLSIQIRALQTATINFRFDRHIQIFRKYRFSIPLSSPLPPKTHRTRNTPTASRSTWATLEECPPEYDMCVNYCYHDPKIKGSSTWCFFGCAKSAGKQGVPTSHVKQMKESLLSCHTYT